MTPLHHLTHSALLSLAAALETGRMGNPIHSMGLESHVPAACRDEVAAELNRLRQEGMAPKHLAYLLRSMAVEREHSQTRSDRLDLVWTGLEVNGSASRDTRIAAQELFRQAQHSVLIASYALDKGKKARELFQELAQRMDMNPSLQVRMFVNVKRNYGDQTPDSILLREFAQTFLHEIWPGTRLPDVFHDPRSLSTQPGPKACLHAKCIVVDETQALITSANFTEAAHERNIEAGVVVTDGAIARSLQFQFESLVNHKILCRVPGL